VLWNGVAGATPRVAILLAGLYVAHHFGTDTFGRYSLALSTFALAGSLPGSTLATVVSKFVPEFARGEGERLGEGFGDILRFTMLLAGATGSAVLLLAPVLSNVFAVVPPVTGLLRSAGVATLAAVVSSGLLGMLMGAGRFGTAAAAQVAGFVLFAIAIVPLSGRLATRTLSRQLFVPVMAASGERIDETSRLRTYCAVSSGTPVTHTSPAWKRGPSSTVSTMRSRFPSLSTAARTWARPKPVQR